MMTFLFWNSKHARGELVGKLVAEHRADVLVLTESSVDPDVVVDEIEKADGARFAVDMWNCFGDERGGPPGTFFRDKGDMTTYFWHLYDQVLLRPSLVKRFLHKDLAILSQCGATSLLNESGEPDSDHASDHLPILFRLDLDAPGATP